MANPTTTAITCTYCFNLPDGTYRDHKSKADLLPISGLRERRLQCPGCKLLCEAIEKCEKFLRGKEKDPNFQFETFKVTTRSNCRSFSKCTLIFQHGIYELIFGEDESACNPFLGRLPTDRENFHVDAANKWISRCQKSHKACRRDQPAPLPRRVIYVGSGDQNLYESKGEAIPYAALSHCWADSLPYHDDTRQQAQSTTSNLSQHKRRLVWNNLPLAFKESICIVRKLGIQYLWIDSLCILQDDAEDWELESGRMANIYQNSAVTIMLHQRKPGDTSLLTTRYSFQLGFNGSPISFQFRSLGEEDTAIEQSRIFQRGWCFQERLLSTRIIHCRSKGIYFECAEGDCCDMECSKEPHSHVSNSFKSMFSLENLPLDNWRTLISQYTQKDLTFPKDILPALSGVANRIRGGGAYYGGLWEKTFVYDLLWFPTVSRNISPIRLPSTGPNYVAPSFLWASVKGPISFIDVLRKSTSKKIVKTLRSHSVTCERRGHDILGELSGGVLIVTAPVIFADFNHHLQAMSANFFIKHLKMEEDCNWATLKIDDGDHYIFHPDSQDSDLSQERLCIVKLFESSELHNNTCYGLVLTIEKPTRNVEELHCLRVGIIASLDKILFETERTVHIH